MSVSGGITLPGLGSTVIPLNGDGIHTPLGYYFGTHSVTGDATGGTSIVSCALTEFLWVVVFLCSVQSGGSGHVCQLTGAGIRLWQEARLNNAATGTSGAIYFQPPIIPLGGPVSSVQAVAGNVDGVVHTIDLGCLAFTQNAVDRGGLFAASTPYLQR